MQIKLGDVWSLILKKIPAEQGKFTLDGNWNYCLTMEGISFLGRVGHFSKTVQFNCVQSTLTARFNPQTRRNSLHFGQIKRFGFVGVQTRVRPTGRIKTARIGLRLPIY